MIKRIAILLLVAVATCTASQAIERPPMAVGFTYDYAFKHQQHGFGLKLQSNLFKGFRIEPEFIYCNEHKDVTTLHLNLNLQNVRPITPRLNLYPFMGIAYSHWGYVGPNANRWGVNLGAGIEYYLGRDWSALTELRLHGVKRETQLLFDLGLKYHF